MGKVDITAVAQVQAAHLFPLWFNQAQPRSGPWGSPHRAPCVAPCPGSQGRLLVCQSVCLSAPTPHPALLCLQRAMLSCWGWERARGGCAGLQDPLPLERGGPGPLLQPLRSWGDTQGRAPGPTVIAWELVAGEGSIRSAFRSPAGRVRSASCCRQGRRGTVAVSPVGARTALAHHGR